MRMTTRSRFRFGSNSGHGINRGYSAYQEMPAKEALNFSVNQRLRNNLPRYEIQVKNLRDLKAIQVTHSGVTLSFKISLMHLYLKITADSKLEVATEERARLPLFPWQRKSYMMRFMAKNEIAIWP